MKRCFLIFILSLSLTASQALAEETVPLNTPDGAPFGLLMVYCMSAVVAGDDAARVAEMDKLMELPSEKALKFLAGQKGRVFTSNETMGKAVLVVPENKKLGCSVLIKTLDYDKFWYIADHWFGPETPMKLVSDETKDDSRQKVFKGDFKGNVMLIVKARKTAPDDMIQGQLVAARVVD